MKNKTKNEYEKMNTKKKIDELKGILEINKEKDVNYIGRTLNKK